MTEPSGARTVPGPPRPGGGSSATAAPPTVLPSPDPGPPDTTPDTAQDTASVRFAELDGRPVGEHVAVFEAEHDRLQRELGTIDQI